MLCHLPSLRLFLLSVFAHRMFLIDVYIRIFALSNQSFLSIRFLILHKARIFGTLVLIFLL